MNLKTLAVFNAGLCAGGSLVMLADTPSYLGFLYMWVLVAINVWFAKRKYDY